MTALTASLIERVLDRGVARARTDSPRARALLEALTGRRLTLEVQGTPWRLTLEASGTALRAVELREGEAADATIRGAPLSLLALGSADAEAVIRRGDVRIEGDGETAEQFRELAGLLKPDLEQLLATPLGRSGAHLMMRGLRGAGAWTRAAARTSMHNIAEYLAHESRDLVSRAEAEHVLRGVDELREQLDRIEARMTRLEQTLPPAGGGEQA